MLSTQDFKFDASCSRWHILATPVGLDGLELAERPQCMAQGLQREVSWFEQSAGALNPKPKGLENSSDPKP